MQSNKSLPIAIIGAGPVGLAAAAQLAARNHPFVLLEAGATVASNVLSWKHVRVFSPWKYNVDTVARQLLETTNWVKPNDEELPTGQELFDHYFKPLSQLPAIKTSIHLNSKVISVGRKNTDKLKTAGRDKQPFVIQALTEGELEQFEAKAIIDTSGTWNSPNPIGSGGLYAVGELAHADKIFYGIPDILHEHESRYKNKNVLVIGSGHSSINAVLELDKLKQKYPATEIHWALRKKNIREVYGGQQADTLRARGALGTNIQQLVNHGRVNIYTPFLIHEISEYKDKLRVIGYRHDSEEALHDIDEIICNTGARPDFSFLREIRLSIDPSLESVSEIAELIDPNIHSCGTVRPHGEKELRHREKDFYIAGSKSYGRAPTFLMATGYEQVRSIVAYIDGDIDAARKVELNLPETGVCSTDAGATTCCGSTVNKNENENNKQVASSCCG